MISRYRCLFAVPGVGSLWLLSLLGRMQLGMIPLATLLWVESQTGSFAMAGLVSGLGTLAAAISGPVKGRWIDRWGPTLVLVRLAPLNALSFVALVLASDHGVGWLIAAGLGIGLTRANITTYMRVAWMRAHQNSESMRHAASGLEAAVASLVFLLGPPLVSLLIWIQGEQLALMVTGLLCSAGSAAFGLHPLSRATPGQAAPSGARRSVLNWAIGLPLLAGGLFELAAGMVQVGLPALAAQEGDRSLAGPLMALMAAGSMTGGILLGARVWPGSRAQQLPWVQAWFVLGLVLLALSSWPWLWASVFLLGLPTAIMIACVQDAIYARSPAHAQTEALSWWVVTSASGYALGNALSGALVDAWGVSNMLWSSCVPAVAAVALAVAAARVRPVSS